MRSFGVRLPILTVAALAGIGLSMSCMGFAYSQTVYVMPTVATVAWPTACVSTRFYVAPTTYSFSSYIPAAYIAEPVTRRQKPISRLAIQFGEDCSDGSGWWKDE